MSFAFARYRSASIETASPLAIVVRLYDGAIAFLREAQEAFELQDVGRRTNALNRAHAIVSELLATLDRRQSPELCAQLEGLYEYVLHQIMQSVVKKDPAELAPALRVLRELREGWAELLAKGG